MKRERDESITRERRLRAEVEELKERLANLSSASRNFAASIRDRTGERRRSRQRLGVQYAVGRVLAEAENLREAAPSLLKILGEELGWDVGVLWKVDEEAGVLRCEALWSSPKVRPGGFEDECRRSSFRRGEGLLGHVWTVGHAVWFEDLLEDWDLIQDKIAAEAGLRGALAFPIQDRRVYGIVELLRLGVSPLDEELRQTATLVGYQIGQFVERRRAEEERGRLLAQLARERAHFEAVLQQMPAGLSLASASGKILMTNDEATRIYRRPCGSAETLDEYARWEAFHPDGQKLPPERYPLARSLLHGEVVEAEEYKILRADGDEALLSVNSAPIRDERGEIVAGVVAFNDITARKQAEEALRKSEERYKALYEDNPFMYFTMDTRGTVLSLNRSGAEQLGYTVEELVGRPMLDLFYEEDKEGVSRYLSACLQDPDCSSAWEARKLRKDGSTLWVKENVRIVQGPDDNTIVLLICEDITERKRAEEANAYLAAIVRSSGDAVIGTSPDGTIESWNPTAERMFGYTAEEAVGRPISLLATPDRYAEQRELISRLRSGEAVSLETVRVAKDGRAVDVILNAAPIMEAPDHMVGISATLTDISERKRAEEERERFLARESVARAEAAERRKISRELHDRVAHSMGIVHQSLQLYKVLLSRDPSQAEVKLALAQEMAKTALDSTRNLAMELRNSITNCDLEDALSNLLRDSVPPDVEAELSVEGDESLVSPHVREQLFLILREAVRNAVSHSGCGRISLHLDVVPEEISGTVEDDGRGFDPEGSANGAGLKSMKERTALVGGACSVLSEPNAGTRVQVSIPLAQER